jgi:hypothetical protein
VACRRVLCPLRERWQIAATIWVYSGNPRYANAPTPIDSIVVIRAALAALAHAPVQVVMTTGYQDVPEEFGTLPSNFHHAAYLPGRAMAEHCDLMVHHGGHSSVMTGLSAGTPAVIIPTITERESNARRLAALGAGEIVLPLTVQTMKSTSMWPNSAPRCTAYSTMPAISGPLAGSPNQCASLAEPRKPPNESSDLRASRTEETCMSDLVGSTMR